MIHNRHGAALACVCFPLALVLASCGVTSSVPSRTQWTVSGTAQFAGTPAATVMLGAFYYTSGSDTPSSTAPISNVVNLGIVAATPTSFSLNIDTSALSPAVGDTIYVLMWEDANANNQMDGGETYSYCVSNSGDAVFTTTTTGLFVFTGSNWYLGATPIQTATETGANIRSLIALN